MGRYLIVEGGAASLPDSGVTAGSYTNTDLVVNSQGIIVSASDGASGASALGNLTDVILTGSIANQIISFDGSDWRNITLNVADNNDVTISAPSTGDFLTYDGVEWVNTAIDVLTSSDIGVAVQAFGAILDSISGLGSTGYIAHTAAGVVAERTFTGSNGININNGNGVAGNTTISVSISTLPYTAPVNPVSDTIMFYNADVAQNEQISIESAVLSATPIISAISVGAGADVFKGINAQVAEFRELSITGLGMTITETVNDIQFGLNSALQTISALTPTNNNFIVGNGVSWTVEDATTAGVTLGLGTMAFEVAVDYLPVAGGVMAGTIDMTGNAINDLLDPASPQDAATKNYVDLQVAVAGDGMIKTGNTLDVVGINGITANANDIELDITYLDTHTDGRYYTQTQLGDTTNTTEGASLIGTETKVGLGNATTVEAALDNINTELPFAKVRFRQDISVWNLDITPPSAIRATVNSVEVARFADGIDAAVYKDLLLPFDFDNTVDMKVYVAMGKENINVGNVAMAMAWQSQTAPGFSSDVVTVFAPGATIVPDATTTVWTIPAGTFSALEVVTLRLTRLGSDGGDTYAGAADLFAAHITQ